jgi:hypothetical protein
MTKTHPVRRYILSITLLVVAAAICGCQVPMNILTSILPPPPPRPRPVWHGPSDLSSNKIDKIAIIVQDASRKLYNDGTLRRVEDAFMEVELGKGYRIADRSDVAQVFNEIRFQHDGLTESDAARLGKMLNVPAVLLVTINSIDATVDQYISAPGPKTFYNIRFGISARLVSVEKAEILGITSLSDSWQEESQNEYGGLIIMSQEVASVIPAHSN